MNRSDSARIATAYPESLWARELNCIEKRRTVAGLAEEPLVGLALSGGGIRSATFDLGLIRALARAKLLRRIDFLSTVSGGGYIGSFLGALFARPEAAGVADGEGKRPDQVARALASPTSTLVARLRENGRYLSPNGSGDTLLAAAVMLRNWLAVLVVVAAALLTLFVAADLLRLKLTPTAWGPELLRNRGVAAHVWWSPWIVLPPLLLATWVIPCAWAYWLLRRPHRRWNWSTLSLVLVPLLFFPAGVGDLLRLIFEALRGPMLAVLRGDLASASMAAAAVADQLWQAVRTERLPWLPILIGLSTAVTVVLWLWRRAGRHQLSVWLKSGLVVTTALLVFAVLDSAGQSIYAVSGKSRDLWRWLALLPAALAGGLVPFAQKLLAVLKPDRAPARARIPVAVLALLAASLVAAFFTVMIAALGDAIAWGNTSPPNQLVARMLEKEGAQTPPAEAASPSPEGDPAAGVDPVEGRHLAGALVVLAALSWCLGQAFSFLNDSTLAPLYAARLRRAYLGASNPEREKDGRKRNVTRDVDKDEVPLKEYRPWEKGGPLHLLNVTLNETTAGSSQVEQRDRRGLGMAFGPGGLSVGVHHHALWNSEGDAGDFEKGLEPVPLEGRFAVFSISKGRRFSPEPLELSRIVAISGAAVSTGLGSRTSLGMSLLLGLLNIRLGHWWYSGIDPLDRETSFGRRAGRAIASKYRSLRSWLRNESARVEPPNESAQPAARGAWGSLGRWLSRRLPVQTHLLHEFLARFPGPASRNWYLSDGGHFENSGCYELIRRRLPLMIVSDCGADPGYEFTDFAHLVRKARLDFGAEIRPATADELKLVDLSVRPFFASPGVLRQRPAEQGNAPFEPIDAERRWNGAHALLCFVDYDDEPKRHSVLLWIKPSLLGSEPPDVLNYALERKSFPQESTADQFFDEAQWESYQRLGLLIGERIFGGRPDNVGLWHPTSLDPERLLAEQGGQPSPVRHPKFG